MPWNDELKRRTPQGVRGLKLVRSVKVTEDEESHSARSAWIETVLIYNACISSISRTPQGVRGLKPRNHLATLNNTGSHSARSAWIETRCGA